MRRNSWPLCWLSQGSSELGALHYLQFYSIPHYFPPYQMRAFQDTPTPQRPLRTFAKVNLFTPKAFYFSTGYAAARDSLIIASPLPTCSFVMIRGGQILTVFSPQEISSRPLSSAAS